MMKTVYKGHEFEAVKLQYETQTSLLRSLTQIDLRIFTGYITVQLVLGGYVAQFSFANFWIKVGMTVIDLTFSIIAAWLLHNNHMRRKEVVGTLRNLSEALGYVQEGIYLEHKALDAPTTFRPWVRWYYVGITTGFIGVLAIIFASPIK